jgi:hypothetical protein
MRSRRLLTRRAVSARVTVAAGTPEAADTPEVAVAILGVEAAGQEVEGAGREAGWDVEGAWAAVEDNKPIAAEAR